MLAARVGATFHLDPLEVLAAPTVDRLIRTAAHNVAIADERRAHGQNGPVTEAEELP